MSAWEPLIARLTDRLGVDAELQLDVAQELRAHLEDSAAEFRGAGQDEDEAAANAARALGDEHALAEQLWQANRARMRFRGALRWAARLSLVPGAVAVVVIIAFGVLGGYFAERDLLSNTAGVLLSNTAGVRWPEPSPPARHLSLYPALMRLSKEQRFVLWGDPSKHGRVDSQRSIWERWPEDPVYYANYIAAYLSDRTVSKGIKAGDESIIDQAVLELSRGDRVDPGNGYYNFVKAGILIAASSTERKYSGSLEEAPNRGPYVEISDPAMFDRGLSEFARGLAKRRLTRYADEMARRRMAQVSGQERLGAKMLVDLMIEFRQARILIGDSFIFRNLGRSISAYSLELVETGKAEEGLRLARGVDMLALRVGARAQTMIGLLNAQAVRAVTLGNLAAVYEATGMEDKARELRGEADRWRAETSEAWRAIAAEHARRLRPQAALPHARGAATSFPTHADLEPARKAEYAVADQVVLLALLAVAAAMALLAAGLTAVGLIHRRRTDCSPTLLFVGWGPLGRICLFAVAIPITLFALYSQVSPFGGRQYGLWYALERVLLEFVLVGAAVAVLLIGLSHSAIRRRANELGIPTPQAAWPHQRWWLAAVTALLSLCAAAYVVCWHLGLFRASWEGKHGEPTVEFSFGHRWVYGGYGFAIATVVGVFMLAWLILAIIRLKRTGGEWAHFRGTLLRSMVPILAAAVIVIGIFCGLALRRAEATAVSRITGRADVGLHNEVELSNFRELRERFVKAHEKLTGQAR